jgi:hypothetical protein
MDILLTESQYIKLIVEKKNSEVESSFSNSTNIVKDIVNDVKSKHGIDFTFAATWGAVLGGFIDPINDYLHGTYTNLSNSDISLISFGILLTFFSSNKEKLNKVLKIIKKEKLITFFDRGLMKAYDLKDAFFSFLESLNVTFAKTSNMLAYAFLIPLIPLFKQISEMNLSSEQIEILIKGLSHYSGTIISSTILHQLIKKMIKRFRS